MTFFERENNDTRGTANNVGTINRTEGIFGKADDINDFYRFRVAQHSKFAATLFPQSQNANLSLLDASGKNIDFSINAGTTPDSVTSDNLAPGDYFLQVSKGSSTPSTDYSVAVSLNPITRAQMSVTVDRIKALENFDIRIPFTSAHKADFFIEELGIDGQSRRSRTFSNNDDVRPNFTFARDVSITRQQIPVSIAIEDADLDQNDFADINPIAREERVRFNFDAVSGKLLPIPSSGGLGFARNEGSTVALEGEGTGIAENLNLKVLKTRVEFRANYNTFTSGSSSSFNQFSNASTFVGKNRSDRFVGQNRSGILDGRNGNDDLSGMGGNDIVVGGRGNDKMRGGKGNDITYGGVGNDVHIGNFGRDTFVLHYGQGVDVIKDYRDGVDKIGLVEGMTYEVLDIRQHGRSVGIYAGSDRMAMMRNVRSNQLDATDFVQVGFAEVQGINTPLVL